MTRENVIEVDAADLDTGGTIVPKGLSADVNDETLDADAFRLDPNRMDRWAVKVYNNADQDVDATPVVSTSDDKTLASMTLKTHLPRLSLAGALSPAVWNLSIVTLWPGIWLLNSLRRREQQAQ